MWSNLAVTLWQGRCQLSDLELHRETLRRIARALGSGYGDEISGGRPPNGWSRWLACHSSSKFPSRRQRSSFRRISEATSHPAGRLFVGCNPSAISSAPRDEHRPAFARSHATTTAPRKPTNYPRKGAPDDPPWNNQAHGPSCSS